MSARRPEVTVRRVHAEPAVDGAPPRAPQDIAWLVLWPDGTVEHVRSARALVHEVRRRDRRDAERADRRGQPSIFATVITWNHTPPGFVPPEE